mgnify:CR=1 FL=1
MKNVMFTALVVLIVGLWLCPPAWAEIESSVVDGIAASSYHKRKATLDKANEAAEAKGLTLEALRKLKPEFYKTRGTIVAEKDGRKVQRFLFIPQMRKLFGMNGEFANNNTQIFIAKFLQNMLN